MWLIFHSELRYNLRLTGFMALVVLVINLYSHITNGPLTYPLLFNVIFLHALMWNVSRNKEIRDQQLARLPVSMTELALARLAGIVIPGLGLIALHLTGLELSDQLKFRTIEWVSILFSLILIGFSFYFISRDRLLNWFRINRFYPMTKERMTSLLYLLIAIINILGIYTFIVQPPWIGQMVGFFIENNPINQPFGVPAFLLFSLIVAMVSVFTYRTRTSYIE